MKKGTVLKVIIAVVFLLIALIISLSLITTGKAQKKPEDFAKDYTLRSADYNTQIKKGNFDLTLKSGTYHVNDCVYVLVDKANTIYAKYVITSEDVNTLAREDLPLYLTFTQNKSSFTFSYYVVNHKDVAQFEKKFGQKDVEGHLKDLQATPHIQKIILSKRYLTRNDFDNNNETITTFLMQSQKYTTDFRLEIYDEQDTKRLAINLTEEQIDGLKRDNVGITYTIDQIIDSYESVKGRHDLKIKLFHNDELIEETSTYFYILN